MSDDTVTPDEERDPVQPIALQDEMENSFLDYAMSVIMSRADRKSTRLNSSHVRTSRMPSSA